MTVAYFAMSFTPAAILLALAVLFVRRRIYRAFPLFFGYVLFAVLATAVRVSVRSQLTAYFWAYWITDAGYGLLALLALNEVFKHLFEFDYKEYWWFRLSLPTAAFVIALVFFVQPMGQVSSYPVRNAVFSFDLGMHCLEGLILILFVVLDKVFAAVYDQYDYGVVRGFGVSAFVTIFADLARSHFGSRYTLVFAYAPPMGYIVATLIWLHAFLSKPPERQRLPITMKELMALMRKQGEAMGKIIHWKYSNH